MPCQTRPFWFLPALQTQLDGLVVLVYLQPGHSGEASATWQDILSGTQLPDQHAVVLAPQIDPALTPHQRAFATRPHMLLQYAFQRGAILSGMGNGMLRPTAYAVSCFSLNARAPQPLFRSDVDLLPIAAAGTYEWLGVSGVGAWLHPLRALNATATEQSAVCEALLRHPGRVLQMSLAGFDKVDALAAAPAVTEVDRLAAQRTFWYHVGSVSSRQL